MDYGRYLRIRWPFSRNAIALTKTLVINPFNFFNFGKINNVEKGVTKKLEFLRDTETQATKFG